MNPLQKNITQIAEQVAEKLGFLLIEVSLKGDNRNRIVEIFIDSLKGVTIDECALMSSEVATIIESTDLISSKYRLDVSSPGIDRPLKFLEQFPKHINRKFELLLKDSSNETEQQQSAEINSDLKQSAEKHLPGNNDLADVNSKTGEIRKNVLGVSKAEIQKSKSIKTQKITGKLLRIEGQSLIFSLNNSETKINFNNIKTARVLISF